MTQHYDPDAFKHFLITGEELKTWEFGKWKGKRYNQTWLREVKLPEIRSRPAPVQDDDCRKRAEAAYHQGKEVGFFAGKQAAATAAREQATQGRKVITLCGSVKFWDEYRRWNAILTLEGNIVFSCGLSLKEGYGDITCEFEDLNKVKKDLDFIHLRKIDLSDEIFVLNVGGYIGDSTKREIAYAESKGKKVRYLESLRRTKEQPK